METTITAWRYSLATVDGQIRKIQSLRRVIAARKERPAYLAQCERQMPGVVGRYLESVRRVSEYEAAMNAAGVEFRRAA